MASQPIVFIPNKREWKRFERALDSKRFGKLANKELRKATRRNGLEAKATIRRMIRAGGNFAANALLTREIKGSSKPLVDFGSGLFQAITSQTQTATSVFIGVQQTSEFFNIAEALHDGRVIPVTPKMRLMFQVLYSASIGTLDPSTLTGRAAELWRRKPGGWLPLKDNTVAIVLPPRPFIDLAFKDDKLKQKVIANWQQAISNVLREIAK